MDTTGIDSTIQELALDRFMEEAYRRYAVLTILDRALPDARDGLKPVQRRILFAMGELNLVPRLPHKKSARVVGEVLGKYHPHGDQSVYDAMVRMAQDFSMRMPLVDGQGNYGSIDGDSAAAMRYTEARLSALGESMLDDLEKDTVDWRPNFDGSLREPSVLPTRFPNLLVNGASGIAVGMSTSILPHNLGEICAAANYVAKNWTKREKITTADLIKFVPGPDLPTGGLLYRYRVSGDDKQDMIEKAYSGGNATMVCQARADITDIGGGKSEIIVTELPYQVQKTTILERIAASRERFAGITDVRDESDYKGMRVVFEVGRGADPQEVWQRLLTHTQMRASLSYNALALRADTKAGKLAPRNLTLRDMLEAFIEHRLVVITRRSEFELKRAQDRLHILEGLLKALDKIDVVIKIIRQSATTEAARDNLMSKLKLSEIQAQAILDMPLRRLAALERQKLEDEAKELAAKVADLQSLLSSEDRRLDVVQAETREISERYATPRRTIIVDAEEGHQARVTVADLVVPSEPQIIVATAAGVQRVNASDWKDTPQRGKPSVRAVDAVLCKVTAAPEDVVALITNYGRLWKGNAGRLEPQTTHAALGLEKGETVIACGLVQPGLKLVIATHGGLIKRTNAEDLNVRNEGQFSPVIALNDGDEVLVAGLVPDSAQIILATAGSEHAPARALRFETGQVNPQATPTARGVAAIKLGEESLLAGAIIEPTAKQHFAVLVAGQKASIRRVPLEEFPVQGRGGQGVQIGKAGVPVLGFAVAPLSGEVDILSTRNRRLRLTVKSIPAAGRAGKGTDLATLLKLDTIFGADEIAGVLGV